MHGKDQIITTELRSSFLREQEFQKLKKAAAQTEGKGTAKLNNTVKSSRTLPV